MYLCRLKLCGLCTVLMMSLPVSEETDAEEDEEEWEEGAQQLLDNSEWSNLSRRFQYACTRCLCVCAGGPHDVYSGEDEISVSISLVGFSGHVTEMDQSNSRKHAA